MTDNEIIRRAIHSIFGHVPRPKLDQLSELHDVIAHANMHLGTNSQARANTEFSNAVAEIVDALPTYYVASMARYITGTKQ